MAANNFKNINYLNLLIETLRSYFAFNSQGQPSILYKFCSIFTSVLQTVWGTITDSLSTTYNQQSVYQTLPSLLLPTFSGWRNYKLIIANCKWQIGQVTNVLNLLFTPNILLDSTATLTVGDTYVVREGSVIYNGQTYYSPCGAFVCVSGHTSFTDPITSPLKNKVQDEGIYITQASLLQGFIPDFAGNPSGLTFYVPDFAGNPSGLQPFINPFNQILVSSGVIIHVPAALVTNTTLIATLIATINQIIIAGINYTIVSI
jgi:hypothetical protein